MNIKRFIAVVVGLGLILTILPANGESFYVDKEKRTNQVFPLGYLYHYNGDSQELLTEADKLISFSPTKAQNGDVLCFMAFSDGEAINYYNQEIPNLGIANISINIEQIDSCGTCVIKSITEGFLINNGPFCLYKITNFEDGFYKVTIMAKSLADGLSTSTWKATDDGGFKEYYFKVGEIGDIIPHNDYPYRLVIKDESYELGEEHFVGKKPNYYALKINDTGMVCFNDVEKELYDKLKGVEIYVYDSRKTFYFDIDELIDFKEIITYNSANFNVRFVYKDGCLGPVADGSIRIFKNQFKKAVNTAFFVL